MAIPVDAKWVVRGYTRGQLLLETWHTTDASKDMEVAAWRSRMAKGEDITRVEIEDRQHPKYPVLTIGKG